MCWLAQGVSERGVVCADLGFTEITVDSHLVRRGSRIG